MFKFNHKETIKISTVTLLLTLLLPLLLTLLLTFSLAYNYKHNFCKDTKSIFIDIFLPNTKPILVGIFYRPLDKNNFVKNLEEKFTF